MLPLTNRKLPKNKDHLQSRFHFRFFVLQRLEETKHERKMRIAKEFSDLIVYCRSVPFREDSKYLQTILHYVDKQNLSNELLQTAR